MNVFLWGRLAETKRLEFILRHPYYSPIEPAVLRGWTQGKITPTVLFGGVSSEIIHGWIADEITRQDLLYLDLYHAVDDEILERKLKSVEVLRNGLEEELLAWVYVAGNKFHILKGGLV